MMLKNRLIFIILSAGASLAGMQEQGSKVKGPSKGSLLEKVVAFNVAKSQAKVIATAINSLQTIGIAPDGSHAFATFTTNNMPRVRIWNVASKEKKEVDKQLSFAGKTSDEKYLVYFSSDKKTISLYRTQKNSLKNISAQSPLSLVAIAPNSNYLLVSSQDNTLKMLKLDETSFTLIAQGVATPLVCQISPDSSRIALGFKDNTLKVWDVTQKKYTSTIDGIEPTKVTAIALSADNKYLAVGLFDNTIRIWNLEKNQEFTHKLSNKDTYKKIAITKHADYLFIQDAKNVMSIYAPKKNRVIENVGRVKSMEEIAAADAFYIIAHLNDNTVKIWNQQKKTLTPILVAKKVETIKTLALTPNEAYCALFFNDKTAQVWNLKTETLIHTFAVDQAVDSLALAPANAQIITHSADGSLKIWGKNLSKLNQSQLLALSRLISSKEIDESEKDNYAKLVSSLPKNIQDDWFSSSKEATAHRGQILSTPESITPAAQPQAQEIIPAPQEQPLQQTIAEHAQSSVSTEPAQQKHASQGTEQQARQEQPTEQQAQQQKQSAVQEPASTQIPVVASAREPQQAGWWGVIKSWIGGWYTSITSWLGSWFGSAR